MAQIIPFPIDRIKGNDTEKSVIDDYLPQSTIGICGFCNRSFSMRLTNKEYEDIVEFMENTNRSPLCPECSANPLIMCGDVITLFGFGFIQI